MTPSEERQRELYEQAVGTEALERQEKRAARFHTCCWWPKNGQHSPLCSKNPDRPREGEAA